MRPAPQSARAGEAPGAAEARAGGDSQALAVRLAAEVDRLKAELEAERARARELAQLAEEDPVTGLLNRRGFLRALERALAHAARYAAPAVLAYLDLDGLKRVNDTLGHAAGDALIAAAGRVLRETTRQSDLVGRLGGDEFALFLWHAGTADVAAKAERLDAAIAAAARAALGDEVAAGASIGLAELRPGESADDLLARADAAMYARKAERGRGR